MVAFEFRRTQSGGKIKFIETLKTGKIVNHIISDRLSLFQTLML